jgi:hypothetical protein
MTAAPKRAQASLRPTPSPLPTLDTLGLFLDLKHVTDSIDGLMHGFVECRDRHGRLRSLIEQAVELQGVAKRFAEAEEMIR